jgi:hypothetical protein
LHAYLVIALQNIWSHWLALASSRFFRMLSFQIKDMEFMTSQTAPDWQLQIGESGASSRYNFNMELERLVCKQTALAA